MKAIILCAGKGTRLRPLTFSNAKHLIPVANKPVLIYGIEAIVEAGVREIGIIVGESREAIREAVGDGSTWGARVTYIEQRDPRGLAHAVWVARDFLGDEPFIMYLGDNLLKEGLREFAETFRRNRPHALILLYKVPNPEQFGIAVLHDGKIARVVEKPRPAPTNLAIVGAYIFDRNVFDSIARIRPSRRNELEITDAIQDLIERGLTVEPHIVRGWWKDTGKPEDILEANRFILEDIQPGVFGKIDANSQIEGKVVVGQGAEIVNSVIRGPAIIGEGSLIANSFVGPFTSIGKNVRIEGSEIEHSVVMEESVIQHVEGRIDSSLIGRNVAITRNARRPQVFRFVLGDNSISELT